MKTPKYALVVRMAAAAVVLAGSSLAVPAFAESGQTGTPTASPAPTPAPTPSPAPTPTPAAGAPVISDAGLAEAVQRDLGLTLDEFNAAGQLAKRAADAEPSLRGLPGYVGIGLSAGQIVVQGTGSELQERVDALNAAGSGSEFALVAPAPAAPATQAAAPELIAASTEQLFVDYVREVGSNGLQAVAYADGHFIIRTGGINAVEADKPGLPAPDTPTVPAATDPGKVSAADFVSRYANVQLEQGAPPKTEEEVFGGQGYVIDGMSICSAGFGAFDGAGRPLVLTAGHCAEDGKAVNASIEPLTTATAAGATTARPSTLAALGTFGFSQFGGPNNSPITGGALQPGNIGTDIAVIKAAPGVAMQPSVTKWRGDAPTFAGADPASPGPSAVKVIGTMAPVQGQTVCRSGRTEGWSCGSIAETGVYVAAAAPTAGTRCTDAKGIVLQPCDLRAFKGFLSYDVQSSGGDSGGPWISGNYAVGTHTGGEPRGATKNFAIATSLEDAMAHIPGGVQLQLFLNKPELSAPGSPDVKAGETIAGRLPAAPASAIAAGSKVRITVGTQKLEVPVDAAGNWTFRAPLPAGQLAFTAETLNGFSRSGTASFTAAVAPAPLAAPEVTTASGAALRGLASVDGTGAPGAVVTLSGDVAGTSTVALDGRWTVPLNRPAFGKVAVTAVLSSPGIADSPSTTTTYTVVPPKPAEGTVTDGRHFSQDALPTTISGSGLEGAAITVLIDGAPVSAGQNSGGAGAGARAVVPSLMPQVLVADGRWSVPFPSGLVPGTHTLAVSQSVDGIPSEPLTVTFSIDAAVAGAAASAAQPGAASVAQEGPAGRAGQLADTFAGVQPPAGDLPAPSGSVPAVPASPAASVPASAAASLPAVPPVRAAPAPDAGAESLLPVAGLAGGSVLLAAALLIVRRRRAVRAALTE